MSRRVLIRPAASIDLDQQARYILANSGLEAALQFYDSAEETFRLLLAHPRMGRMTVLRNPHLANTRMFPLQRFDRHIVFYRPVRKGTEIVRVVPGARDHDAL